MGERLDEGETEVNVDDETDRTERGLLGVGGWVKKKSVRPSIAKSDSWFVFEHCGNACEHAEVVADSDCVLFVKWKCCWSCGEEEDEVCEEEAWNGFCWIISRWRNSEYWIDSER